MNSIPPEVWIRLAAEGAHGDALWARRAIPGISERVLAAMDAGGSRHILILLQPGDTSIQDSQSRGLGVITRELSIRGQEVGRYLDITCVDAAGHGAFDLIGGELADRLAAGGETASEIVARVLSKWRRFWGQSSPHSLSKERQLGLFAELWFLNFWMFPRCSTNEAVKRWRGPFGARHDFEWTRQSVEVKATTSTRGRIHLINGIEQLLPPATGSLLFFSLRLREEAGASNTLPALVNSCRSYMNLDPTALNDFEIGLSRAGYSPIHESEYENLKVRIVEEGLFTVRENFPRITPEYFITGVPPGIEHIEYEINLSGFMHLCVAKAPSEAFPF